MVKNLKFKEVKFERRETYSNYSQIMDHVKDLKIAITAGASGIGSEVAIALSKAGAEVMICDVDEGHLKSFSDKNPQIFSCNRLGLLLQHDQMVCVQDHGTNLMFHLNPHLSPMILPKFLLFGKLPLNG